MKGCSVPIRENVPFKQSDLIFQYRHDELYTDDGTTKATDASPAIQQFTDMSGNGYHLNTTNVARKPQFSFSSGIQRKPAATFDGAGDGIDTGLFDSPIDGPFDIFVVCRILAHANNDHLFDAITADTLALQQITATSGTGRYNQFTLDGEYGDNIAGLFTINSGFHLIRLKLDGDNSAIIEDTSETAITWQTAGPDHVMDGFTLGAKGGNAANFIQMDWLETFAFNSIKSGTVETNIYNYLIDQYAIPIL